MNLGTGDALVRYHEFPECGEYLFDDIGVPWLVVALLNEMHFLGAFVLLENVVHLLEGHQGVLLGGYEDSRAVFDSTQVLEIYLV